MIYWYLGNRCVICGVHVYSNKQSFTSGSGSHEHHEHRSGILYYSSISLALDCLFNRLLGITNKAPKLHNASLRSNSESIPMSWRHQGLHFERNSILECFFASIVPKRFDSDTYGSPFSSPKLSFDINRHIQVLQYLYLLQQGSLMADIFLDTITNTTTRNVHRNLSRCLYFVISRS